ncbi:hypothetical protein, partial [Bacillus subtilis]|uniref:hypothetical protein n=1 Tax=Bacillus subtilis TaxID=1423 RepID=UPI001BDBB033
MEEEDMTPVTFANPSLHNSIYVIFYHQHSCEKRKKTAIFSFVTPHVWRYIFKKKLLPSAICTSKHV